MSTQAPVVAPNPRKPFLARTVTIAFPAIVAAALSLLAGGLQVVNQVVLVGHPEIQAAIAVFLVFLVGIGVNPVTGGAFRSLLHLPVWATTLITALVSAATGILQIAAIGQTAHIIVATVLTVLASLGFGASQGSLVPVPGPVVSPTPAPPPAAHRRK